MRLTNEWVRSASLQTLHCIMMLCYQVNPRWAQQSSWTPSLAQILELKRYYRDEQNNTFHSSEDGFGRTWVVLCAYLLLIIFFLCKYIKILLLRVHFLHFQIFFSSNKYSLRLYYSYKLDYHMHNVVENKIMR